MSKSAYPFKGDSLVNVCISIGLVISPRGMGTDLSMVALACSPSMYYTVMVTLFPLFQ